MRTKRSKWTLLVGASAAVVALLALVAAGCGSANDDALQPATRAEITEFQTVTGEVRAAAEDYGEHMASSQTADAEDCRRVHEAYHDRVAPRVGHMMDMSESMDTYMHHHRGESLADVHCVAEAMRAELDHHAQAACASDDIAQARREATRHRDAMLGYADHMWERCDEMMGTVGDDGPQWGPMMDGCQAYDGMSGRGHHWMMDGDHHHRR
ncbi:hypothetical protein FIV42_22560 [Persicimonas caeni]|uniref:Lipoprotein n=1 Tax=Persicimonas caeni TaxID=2292766 RepID=A0A4Y6PYT4_PERCE|nr:hypothetical protein [Persicimonas caeni]QDG53423.1 hypothetical protein FIV42_22560 [Persicimonas caeni]QED34644.1 hypothetical protein FRD00_22555 [Persicimonas caeni]